MASPFLYSVNPLAKSKHPSKKTRQGDDSFKSVAKRLECDEDKGRFEAKLGKIAKAKPKDKK
jgi:hypothetical protein